MTGDNIQIRTYKRVKFNIRIKILNNKLLFHQIFALLSKKFEGALCFALDWLRIDDY